VSIPIVMVHTPDPVQLGLVAGLGRPGVNVTGTITLSADLSMKTARTPQGGSSPGRENRRPVESHNVAVRAPDDLDKAFATMTRERTGAVPAPSDPMTFFHRTRLADLGAKHRLPTMHGVRGLPG